MTDREPEVNPELLLADMQRRLAKAPRAKDPLRAALAHQQRRERADAELAEPELPTKAEIANAPEPERVDYASDRDPREDEPWFRGLPEHERERLRAAWYGERHRFDDLGAVARKKLVRALWQGALVFFLLGIGQGVFMGLGPVVPLAVAGGLAGLAAQAAGGGRFVFSLCGLLAYFAVMGPMLGLSVISALSLMCALIAAFGMGALGMQNEMEQRGGFTLRGARPEAPAEDED